MKTDLNKHLIGKKNLTNGFVALFVIALIALGCTCNDKKFDFGQSKDDATENSEDTNVTVPENTKKEGSELENETEDLVKESIADFSDAVEEEDFGGFIKTTSKDFQRQYTKRKMKNAFKSFITQKSKTVPILESVQSTDIEFSKGPNEEQEKGGDGKMYDILTAEGTFATSPSKTIFDFKYVKQNGDWKLISINLQLR